MSDITPNFDDQGMKGPEPDSIFTRKKPKSSAAPRDSVPKGTATRGRPNKHNQRKEKVLVLLSTVGTAVAFFEQFDGQVILMQAENVAEATASLADEVPAVAKAIDAMSTGGAYGAFILALCSMVLPIAAHHNLIPDFLSQALVPKNPHEDSQAA